MGPFDHALKRQLLHDLIGVSFLHQNVLDKDEIGHDDLHKSLELFLYKFIYDQVHRFQRNKSTQHWKVPPQDEHFHVDLVLNSLCYNKNYHIVVHIEAVVLDELDCFGWDLFALLHIVKVDFFVVMDVHNEIHDLKGFKDCFRVVCDTGSDYVHALNVAQNWVQVVKLNQHLS